MKKLDELNLDSVLTRDEMKKIVGGDTEPCKLVDETCNDPFSMLCCQGLTCVGWPDPKNPSHTIHFCVKNA